jgi:hypothetical protein
MTHPEATLLEGLGTQTGIIMKVYVLEALHNVAIQRLFDYEISKILKELFSPGYRLILRGSESPFLFG